MGKGNIFEKNNPLLVLAITERRVCSNDHIIIIVQTQLLQTYGNVKCNVQFLGSDR